MLKSILKLQMVSPVSVGLGGPFCGLLHALSGYHKILPFWALCPLWCLIFAPLILLFPVLLPIYVVSVLQSVYRKQGIYSYMSPDELEDTAQPLDDDADDQRFRYTYLENAPSSQLSSLHSLNSEKVLAHGVPADNTKKKNRVNGFDSSLLQDDSDDNKTYRMHVVGFIQQNIKINLLHYKHLIVFSQLVYWMMIALISYGIVYFSFLAFQEYHTAALQHRTLQIATPEQLAYADKIVAIFTTGGMLIWATLLYVIAITFTSAIGCFNPAAVARKILSKNFLALAVVSCLLCAVGNLTERYYAHYVLIAYEDIILGNEHFNPAFLFLALRCLIVYVFCMGLSISMLMSLRLLPMSFKANTDLNPDGGSPKSDSQDDANQDSQDSQGSQDPNNSKGSQDRAATAPSSDRANTETTAHTQAQAQSQGQGHGQSQSGQSNQPSATASPQPAFHDFMASQVAAQRDMQQPTQSGVQSDASSGSDDLTDFEEPVHHIAAHATHSVKPAAKTNNHPQ